MANAREIADAAAAAAEQQQHDSSSTILMSIRTVTGGGNLAAWPRLDGHCCRMGPARNSRRPCRPGPQWPGAPCCIGCASASVMQKEPVLDLGQQAKTHRQQANPKRRGWLGQMRSCQPHRWQMEANALMLLAPGLRRPAAQAWKAMPSPARGRGLHFGQCWNLPILAGAAILLLQGAVEEPWKVLAEVVSWAVGRAPPQYSSICVGRPHTPDAVVLAAPPEPTRRRKAAGPCSPWPQMCVAPGGQTEAAPLALA